ncbi:hypothetical protein R1sor_017519 [Riccia sorocarpa]|uniref:Reverse transcriptase domain-containing protein n=1 Tax=Riccia sorocarpa TaxID=122646 RepID=A0ABD3I743_9MARC
MSCTYKIISKLIARRLQGFLPGLVDAEQTGFVPGRRIEDNVMTLKMAEEWSYVADEDNLFVKLDFSKAFDRVSFKFMWGVLQKMGLSRNSIDRIRALMVGGSSCVHVNQDLTAPVKIKRGVRQGCPLAPLLFALSTQPLMRALQEAEKSGELRGLKLPNLRTITHELFADDTSVFISAVAGDFKKIKTVIEQFERASGAALNMQKSLVKGNFAEGSGGRNDQEHREKA